MKIVIISRHLLRITFVRNQLNVWLLESPFAKVKHARNNNNNKKRRRRDTERRTNAKLFLCLNYSIHYTICSRSGGTCEHSINMMRTSSRLSSSIPVLIRDSPMPFTKRASSCTIQILISHFFVFSRFFFRFCFHLFLMYFVSFHLCESNKMISQSIFIMLHCGVATATQSFPLGFKHKVVAIWTCHKKIYS